MNINNNLKVQRAISEIAKNDNTFDMTELLEVILDDLGLKENEEETISNVRKDSDLS